MKTPTEILAEYSINIMLMDDTFNSHLLASMERYAEEKVNEKELIIHSIKIKADDFKHYTMTKIKEKIVKWEQIKFAYDVWLETLNPKYKIGKTIYTDVQQTFSAIVDDLKSLNEETAKDLPVDNEIEDYKKETPDWLFKRINKDDEFYKSCLFVTINDVQFGMWLGENGWQFYDGHDRLINLKANNIVLPITELFADYKKEKQER